MFDGGFEVALAVHDVRFVEDGLTDFDEIYGYRIRFRGDLAFSDLTDKFCADLRTGESCTVDACLDPLVPDQVVTLTIRFDVQGDGDPDPAGGDGEFGSCLLNLTRDVPGAVTTAASFSQNVSDGSCGYTVNVDFTVQTMP